MNRRRDYLLLVFLFAVTAFWAVAQPSADELEQNRQKLQSIRKNTDQLARLRDSLQGFLSLPEKRREKVIQLDHDLHDWPPAKKARYLSVLERYADWLEQLRQDDPGAYKAIKDAPNAESRLALIKDRRDREWMQSQPIKQREEWAKLMGPARSDYVAKLRQDDRQRHQQWIVAQRFWKELETKKELPCRLSDFTEKVKSYVKEYLLPKLSEAEKKQLADAEGRWPDYPMTLVEIASKRPAALPAAAERPRRFDELPEPIRKHLIEKKVGKDVAKAKVIKQYTLFNDSSNFASKVVETARENGKVPFENEYLACSFQSLQKPMRDFVNNKLVPAMKDSPADNRKFSASEGKWPDYPEAIRDLAQKYNLQPPWQILPEPEKWKWDNYRYLKRRPTDQTKDQPDS